MKRLVFQGSFFFIHYEEVQMLFAPERSMKINTAEQTRANQALQYVHARIQLITLSLIPMISFLSGS